MDSSYDISLLCFLRKFTQLKIRKFDASRAFAEIMNHDT